VQDFAAFAKTAVDTGIPAKEFCLGGCGFFANPARFSCARFAAYKKRTFPV
jgi:hypothetical protein